MRTFDNCKQTKQQFQWVAKSFVKVHNSLPISPALPNQMVKCLVLFQKGGKILVHICNEAEMAQTTTATKAATHSWRNGKWKTEKDSREE